jgi:hypothetical protein
MAMPRSVARASVRGLADTHDQRHHGTHGTGDAGGVGFEVGEIVVEPPFGVPAEPLEQGLGQPARDGEALDHAGEGAIGGIVDGLAGIDGLEALLEPGQGGQPVVAEIDASSASRQKA